jgi:hypothetical protein
MGNCFCQNKEDKPLKKVAFSDNHVPPLEVPEEIFEPIKQVVPTLKRKITEINVNEPEVSVKRVVDREEPGTILHQINTLYCSTI